MMGTIDTMMWLPTLRALWLRGTYVTAVTLYMNICTNVTNVFPVYCYTPWTKDQTKYCGICNERYLSETCFQNHLTFIMKGKLVCQWRQLCRNCSYLVTGDSKHEFLWNSVLFVIRSNLQAIFATWPHWNLASCRTIFVHFLRYSVHTIPSKAWWFFWACTEPHKCSAKVKCEMWGSGRF